MSGRSALSTNRSGVGTNRTCSSMGSARSSAESFLSEGSAMTGRSNISSRDSGDDSSRDDNPQIQEEGDEAV